MTHLQKIVARAKQIRKAHPKKIWTDCIKAASRELKKSAPKKATAKKAVAKKHVAKKRVAGLDKVIKSGNRTSVQYSRKPKATKKKTTQGKLFGIGAGVTAKINAELSSIERHEKAAQHAMDLVKQEVTKAAKAAHRKTHAYHKKAITIHKANMRNLKKLL